MLICSIQCPPLKGRGDRTPFSQNIKNLWRDIFGPNARKPRDSQMEAFCPSPILTSLKPVKRSRSDVVQGVPNTDHARGGSSHASQSHLSRRAEANLRRCKM